MMVQPPDKDWLNLEEATDLIAFGDASPSARENWQEKFTSVALSRLPFISPPGRWKTRLEALASTACLDMQLWAVKRLRELATTKPPKIKIWGQDQFGVFDVVPFEQLMEKRGGRYNQIDWGHNRMSGAIWTAKAADRTKPGWTELCFATVELVPCAEATISPYRMFLETTEDVGFETFLARIRAETEQAGEKLTRDRIHSIGISMGAKKEVVRAWIMELPPELKRKQGERRPA